MVIVRTAQLLDCTLDLLQYRGMDFGHVRAAKVLVWQLLGYEPIERVIFAAQETNCLITQDLERWVSHPQCGRLCQLASTRQVALSRILRTIFSYGDTAQSGCFRQLRHKTSLRAPGAAHIPVRTTGTLPL